MERRPIKISSTQVVDYAHLLWSPDGKQLAATFSVLVGTAILNNGGIITKSLQGVLLMSPSDAQPLVLSHALADKEYYSGLWNLSAGAYIPLTTAPPNQASTNSGWYADPAFYLPALRYQWGDDGHLQPMTPLNAANAPASQPDAPIGQPDGGSDFSVWQPRAAQVITRVFSDDPGHAPQQLKTPVETWQSSFGAWSPDGKRLAVEAPVPDATGQRLPQITDFAVHIYDCASGKLLETLTPNLQLAHVTSGFQATSYLRWSPDGSHLLVYDPNLDGAQIWGPDELPR